MVAVLIAKRVAVHFIGFLFAVLAAFATPVSCPLLESTKWTLYSLKREGRIDAQTAWKDEVVEWRLKTRWFPNSFEAHYRLGVALACNASGKPNAKAMSAEALNAFLFCLNLKPDDVPTLVWLGDVYADRLQNPAAAVPYYQRAFDIDPSYGWVESKLQTARQDARLPKIR